jgi:tetratricopeptide (TPR) repeat protein
MIYTLKEQLIKLNELIRTNPHRARAYIQRGMIQFKLAQINNSIADFDRAEQLDSSLTPYLWQRGISYYYAQRFEEGAKQFEIDLTVNAQDAEETIWRYLCIAQARGVEAAKTVLLPVRNDPRRVMRQVYELFAGHGTLEDALEVGDREGQRGQFYSYLYAGLYCEASGDRARSQSYLLRAVSQYPIDDYMWDLARVHCQLRGWQ